MGKGAIIGLGIGAGVEAVLLLIVLPFVWYTEDARMGAIQAFNANDGLLVILILTDSNGDHTKADGHLELVVRDGNVVFYRADYTFTKDDFSTWPNNFGEKTTAYRMEINKFFPSGFYDVYANLETKKKQLKGLHDTFFSLN